MLTQFVWQGHAAGGIEIERAHFREDRIFEIFARRLALFHHEPTYSDEDIRRMHLETIRYEELNRGDRAPLEILCAYDGLEVTV